MTNYDRAKLCHNQITFSLSQTTETLNRDCIAFSRLIKLKRFFASQKIYIQGCQYPYSKFGLVLQVILQQSLQRIKQKKYLHSHHSEIFFSNSSHNFTLRFYQHCSCPQARKQVLLLFIKSIKVMYLLISDFTCKIYTLYTECIQLQHGIIFIPNVIIRTNFKQ